MSQAVVSSKKTDPLRQQLDELDQLMQRMLALGVNQSPPDFVPDPEPEAVEFVEVGAQTPARAESNSAGQKFETVTSQSIEIPAPVDSDAVPAITPPIESLASQQIEAADPTDPARESEIDLAFRAPTFVSIDAIAATVAVPLYADFQFASTSSGPILEDPAPAADYRAAAPPSESAKGDPTSLQDFLTMAPPSESAEKEPTLISVFNLAAPPSEPAERERAPIPDFQFAPPPSERVSERLTADPAPALAFRLADPIIFVAWWLRPLAMVNGIYDGSTRWLGPIGRGLRSRPMRNLLGLCGLAALVGAAAWVLWEGTDWNS